MKDSLRYLMLWQKKRSELPVNDDPQNDWLQVSDLLDEAMPVSENTGGKPSFFKGLRILPTLFIALSAAAMIYTTSRIIIAQKHKHAIPAHHRKYKMHYGKDSLTDTTSADSMIINDNIDSTKTDSLAQIKQAARGANIGEAKPLSGEVSANKLSPHRTGKDSSAQFKKESSAELSGTDNVKPATGRNGDPGRHLLTHTQKTGSARSDLSDKARRGLSPDSDFYSNSTRTRLQKPSGHDRGNDKSQQYANSTGNSSPLLIALSPPNTNNLNPVTDGGGFSRITPVIKRSGADVKAPASKQEKNKKDKTPSIKKTGSSKTDWGVLIGANSNGSNKFPADRYFGPYATFSLNNKLGLNVQLRLLSPQNVSGSYAHANGSKVDTNIKTFLIKDSRKIYSISIPLYLEYKATDNLRLKAGPVFSIPVRQAKGKYSFQPDSIRKDSAYYANTKSSLNKTKYQQKLNYGISAGVSYQVKRLTFEATYLKDLAGQKITSDLGGYKYTGNTFQLTIGFQLNKK